MCSNTWKKRGLILAFWMIVWQMLALWIHNPILLVTPVSVIKRMVSLIQEPAFYETVLFSSMRVFLGFVLAWVSGFFLGILAYKVLIVQEFLSPFIHVMKTIPVASFIVLALIWMGTSNLTFFVVFVVTMPIVYESIVQGLLTTQKEMLEVAKIFEFSLWKKIWYIYRPVCIPFLINSATITIGLSWKSGVAAEVIGIPEHSIGERLYMAKISLETVDLFAWTLTMIGLSVLFEKGILFLMEKFCVTKKRKRKENEDETM